MKPPSNLRDIAELPPIARLDRRQHSQGHLRFFCETYFPHYFTEPWTFQQLGLVLQIERAILRRDDVREQRLMPRNAGTTPILFAATLWALLHGHRQFVCLISHNELAARVLREAVWDQLQHNTTLAEDFPETCLPIRMRDGIEQRQITFRGEPVRISKRGSESILPRLDSLPNECCVAMLHPGSRFKGLILRSDDGTSCRPDFLIVDGVQIDGPYESARERAERRVAIKTMFAGLSPDGFEVITHNPGLPDSRPSERWAG